MRRTLVSSRTSSHSRVRARFREKDRKCQTMIELRDSACRHVSVLPLQIGQPTRRMNVRRRSRPSDTHRG